MRVALIAPEKLPVPPIRGGAVEIYIHELSRRLSRQHQVTVYCPQDPELPEQEGSSNLNFNRLPHQSTYQYQKALLQYVPGSRYDVMHIFNRPKFVLSLAPLLPAARTILNLHNNHLTRGISYAEASACISLVSKIVTNSCFLTAQTARKLPSFYAKSQVIYPGVDIEEYRPVWERMDQRVVLRHQAKLDGKRAVLFVGRLKSSKGTHILIQALTPLMRQDPNLVLIVVGGPEFHDPAPTSYTHTLHQVDQAIKGQILFTGFVPPHQMQNIYLMADLLVCPSQWEEPFGRVNMEAMAIGIPVLASARGGIPEIIEHGETGLLVDGYNDPAQFTRYIEFLFANPQVAQSMARKGRQRVEHCFSWEKVTEEMQAIYETGLR